MAEQKLLLGNVRGPQGPAGPNEVSASTTTSGFENGHVLVNNNGKVGGKKLTASDVGARPDSWTPSAEDVGAIPKGHTKTLASGLAWKSGSILTPDGWDDYSMIRISTNFGSAFIPKLAVNESSGNILVASALPNNYMNIAGFSIARNSTGGSLSIDVSPYALRLAPSGVTALSTELSVYKIEGFA